MRYILNLILICFFCKFYAAASYSGDIYLGSREGDPATLVENVSTIHGDYSEHEIDLIVPGPDPLTLSRYYSSRDHLLPNSLGGWRFNPHCFLYVQKEILPRTYTTAEGTFNYSRILIGTNEGSILTYAGWKNITNPGAPSLFKPDAEDRLLGLSNIARGSANNWTNLKNNQLYFDPQQNHFELTLASGGKRLYVSSLSTPDLYLLKVEILPSGNKIFYEYEGESVCEMKMTNAQEEKVLSWISIEYGSTVHIHTSDSKTVDYYFDPDFFLLSEVVRSDQPCLKYEYQVVAGHPVLVKRNLPEGHFVKIGYYTDEENKGKVESITTPAGTIGETATKFSYFAETDDCGFTQVDGPLARKAIYRFNDQFQLTAIEQYLNEGLYRIYKKNWGTKKDSANLLATSVEDASGAVYYYKSLVYDDKGSILEEKEYGNLTGSHPEALILDEEGIPEETAESHGKTYSYRTVKDLDVITQKDAKGSAVKLYYKKNTNILFKKLLLEKKKITKRWFYSYNEDGALIQVLIDDGDEENFESGDSVSERHITAITPKQQLPHVGAPEVIEEKYLDPKQRKKILLKKRVNRFDSQGNIQTTEVYDATGVHRYTLTKNYSQGLLKSETDPMGNETRYSYDENQNLIGITHSNSSLSFEYQYDLKNRLTYIGEKDSKRNCFETLYTYDAAGNKTSETDRYGNKKIYLSDDLNRITTVTYPSVKTDEYLSFDPIYIYDYDLFDRVIKITAPNDQITQKTYTVRGAPTLVRYPDGTQEIFKYDPEGSLHRHLGKDGIVKVFEYDYQGRLAHIEYYQRGSKGKKDGFKREYYGYDAFHLTSHQDEEKNKTIYTYDGAGRLATSTKEDQKIEFIYDSLGRKDGIKKWKSGKTFTLQIQEYDLLDRITEQRIEDTQGKILVKNRRIYDDAGLLQKILAYPKNEESVLAQYDYDDFYRLCKITDAVGAVTKIEYEDSYIDEWGRKVLKRTQTDPLGNRTEEIFNPAGHLAKTTQKDKKELLLAESVFFFGVDGNLNLEKNAVVFNGAILRSYNACKSYSQGNLVSKTIQEKSFIWEYDSFGNVSSITKPGIIEPITYKYDAEGNIEFISYKGDKESQKTTCKLTHDNKGNIKEVRLGKSSSIAYKVNANDLLTSKTVKDELGSYEVKISYDGEGGIETIQLPDGSLIKYIYEGPLVKSVSRQSKEKKELYNHRIISRDQMGHVLEEVLIGHAGARKQTWDKAGRMTGIFTDFFSDQVPEEGYDLLHNIKKRNSSLQGIESKAEYEYNARNELISEKNRTEHTYSYDSLGNRLKKNSSLYKINDLNQILEAEGKLFTFDPAGHLETKTFGEKTSGFQTNPLGHLISAQTPNETIITFAYDLRGKRISKKAEAKGKKTKIYRYFYLGDTELGSLDEKGNIVELKVPSDPNNPEASSSVAIEIKGEAHAPVYDLLGNIVCLIDPQQREIEESYSYSAFGEEEIKGQKGKTVSDAPLGNPWRYKGKRMDSEIGLIYFGNRYYDPAIGRWISPDPMGNIDGPNLYRFCRNNPLKFVDHFGLASETTSDEFNKYFYGEVEPRCFCEQHRDCKRGGDIRTAIGGASLGVSSFFMDIINQLAEVGFLATADDFGFDSVFKAEMHDAMEHSLDHVHGMWNEGLVSAINFDPQSENAQFYEKSAYTGLVALDIARGNIKDIRNGLAFLKNQSKFGLTVDLSSTIERIQKGVKFSHRNDGTIFKNREGLLPKKHSSYYREYVHPTPGIEGPGARRVIVGENSEMFYSPDHYKTFVKIN